MSNPNIAQFDHDSENIAREAMVGINPNLTDKFVLLICFLAKFPYACSQQRGKNAPLVGSKEYIYSIAKIFSDSRKPRKPSPPTTIPDKMVGTVLHTYFGIPDQCLERIEKEHALSMGAENIIGDLLERYLAHILEQYGWIWCSGTIVKAVDFIKFNPVSGEWYSLQVKNRDNTENSSSSAIRLNTPIKKWFRTFSKKNDKNWDQFPDESVRHYLSEDGFKSFAQDYLKKLK